MQIHVPEDLGGDLRVIPDDTYRATIADVFIGKSKSSGQPKATVKWTITSEYSGPTEDEDYVTTVGETVLDTYSLQPQAIWRLNDTYKLLTNDRLPMGDYSDEEFGEIFISVKGEADVEGTGASVA